jgi:hypothetical protein
MRVSYKNENTFVDKYTQVSRSRPINTPTTDTRNKTKIRAKQLR